MKSLTVVRLALLLIGLVVPLAAARAQSYPPLWKSTSSYLPGDQVQEGGNVYRCIRPVTTPNQDPARIYTYWELAEVRAYTILFIGVGEPFPNLSVAWAYGLNARIAPSAYLHFYVVTTHGAYLQTLPAGGFNLDHPFGAYISIIGDSKAGNEFYVPTTSKGFFIDNGHVISSLMNLRIIGSSNATDGVIATSNAVIGLISNCYINGFLTCLHVSNGGSIRCDNQVTFFGPEIPDWNTAVMAETSGRVSLASGTTVDGGDNSKDFCVGLQAQTGGRIDAASCTIETCSYCVFVTSMGTINVASGTIQDGVYNFKAHSHGFIDANSVTIGGGGDNDVWCYDDSHISMIGYHGTATFAIGAGDGSVVGT